MRRFTWGVFDDAASRSVEVSMNIDIAWQSEGTHEEINQLSFLSFFYLLFKVRVCVCRTLFITCSEVAFDNHLVLLLIPSCNNEVILWADEPQELLKPVKRGEMVEWIKGSTTCHIHIKILNQSLNIGTYGNVCLTSRPSWPSEWWSQSEPLSVFSVFFSLQIS